jgi:hypothetical protein
MGTKDDLKSLSDDELLRRLSRLLGQFRRVESELIAHIAEVDERRLYAREASASMFAYCTEVLHLSEAEAYLRIAVARASRQHPVLLEMLADGRLHLSGIERLAPHLTPENREDLLARAAHRSKRQIEELVAELAPKPDAPSVMRKLPEAPGRPARAEVPLGAELRPDGVGPSSRLCRDSVESWDCGSREAGAPGAIASEPARPVPAPVVEPLAPARYKVQFTASAALHGKLKRLKELMRSSVPDGDLAAVIEAAVTEKLERLEARRFAKTKAPRKSVQQTDLAPSSRRIPAAVRRSVYERDQGRCTYVDDRGRRCSSHERLEFHHQEAYGRGGDHSPENIRLVCRTHNLYLAEGEYGRKVMGRYRRPRDFVSEPGAVYSTRHPDHRTRGAEPAAGPG